MPNPKDYVLKQAIDAYLKTLDMNNLPSREERAQGLYAMNMIMFSNENAGRAQTKDVKLKLPDTITDSQLAYLIAATEPVKCIRCVKDTTDDEYDLLGLYQTTGPAAGTYATDSVSINRMIYEYNREVTPKRAKDIATQLMAIVPHVDRCSDPDLIAVNNGLFDFKTKQLMPFDPSKIYLSKSHINYNPQAYNINIHNTQDGTDWNVEDWIMEISNNNVNIANLIWEIMSACCRPFVPWNKAAFFYSTTGNNGKGTLCVLMRNLVGQSSCANIPLSEFSKEFALEPLIHSNCIIVDENDVGGYIDKVGNLKAVITGDTIQLTRKFKAPIYYQFRGMMIQCINDMPRIRDRSNSFYRRQLFVPFQRCFTGAERQYIKNVYLNMPEVLEYVLFKCLNMTHYELSNPVESQLIMREYKLVNDTVRDFCDEIIPQLKWDLIPFQFLYDVYIGWFAKNQSSGSAQGRNSFIKDLIEIIREEYPEWSYPGKDSNGKHVRIAGQGRMTEPEPLIVQFNCTDWKNPNYTTGTNVDKICTFFPGNKYFSGIIRTSTQTTNPIQKEDTP